MVLPVVASSHAIDYSNIEQLTDAPGRYRLQAVVQQFGVTEITDEI
ncbi:MAG TPA: hypothetical protein V6D35_08800 [Candidatus Sericytochromatia bacterium]